MKIFRTTIAVMVLAAAALSIGSPAIASEPTAQYLTELHQIAAQPTPYRQIAGTPAQAPTLDPFQCTLYPSVVHERTSSGRLSVGAKPYTQCKAGNPTIISQSSTLDIVEWAGAVYKPMTTATATSRGVPSLEQKNVEWFCINRNISTFQQETKGYTVQNGRTFQSSVISRKDDINCGY